MHSYQFWEKVFRVWQGRHTFVFSTKLNTVSNRKRKRYRGVCVYVSVCVGEWGVEWKREEEGDKEN